MKNVKNEKNYYLGLDIGTDSVGYAVTDEEYNLIKFHGEPAWGVTLFDAASLSEERRSFRTARRRLDRRQQRVILVQELFAREIDKKDSNFYRRLAESRLYRDETGEQFTLFNDKDFTDKEYYEKYPTIHHLIEELMYSEEPHDVRLVYIACSWLVAHRGHFLSNINKDNLSELKDFASVYEELMMFFVDNGYEMPWDIENPSLLGNVLKAKMGVNNKTRELIRILYEGKKPSKEATETFPYNKEAIVKLLAGGTCKLKDLFCNDEYDEHGTVSLGMDDDKLNEIMAKIGDDFGLVAALRSVMDWAVLVDVLGEYNNISEAKVAVYDRHKEDLATLKRLIKKYVPSKYAEVFRDKGNRDNYVAYSYHTNDGDTSGIKKVSIEGFSKYILGIINNIQPDKKDEPIVNDVKERLARRLYHVFYHRYPSYLY